MLTGVRNLNTDKACGKTNWRMPSIRELRTLANYNVNNNTGWLNSLGFAVSEYRDPASFYSTSTTNLNGQTANSTVNPWVINLAYLETGANNTQVGTNKITDYLGAMPVSGGTVIKPAAKAKPALTDKVIFITEKGYTKFVGISGADAICNQEAAATGSLINKKAKFKALLVSSNRYPCNSNGVCGVDGASDWPITVNTKYTTIGNNGSLSSNANGVFTDYAAGLILDQFGYRQDKMFWLGINGVLGDANGKVSAWSYANLDGIWTPKNVGGLWDRYTNNTAMDWTFPASVSTAGIGDNGYFADSTYKILVNKNVGMAFDYATLFASSNSQISRWVVANKTFVDQNNRLTYGVQYQTHLICVQQ